MESATLTGRTATPRSGLAQPVMKSLGTGEPRGGQTDAAIRTERPESEKPFAAVWHDGAD